jgi:hypothetical protein
MKPASGQDISCHALSGDFFNSLGYEETYQASPNGVRFPVDSVAKLDFDYALRT